MTACPPNLQLPIDDIDSADDGGYRLGPRLPAPLVGLQDPALGALTVVAEPIGKERRRAFAELHQDAGIDRTRRGDRPTRQSTTDRTHLDFAERNFHD